MQHDAKLLYSLNQYTVKKGKGKWMYIAQRPGRAVAPPRPLLTVPNVTAHRQRPLGQCTNFILFSVAL